MIGHIKKKQGLTLVELALTLIIIGILAAAMSPGLGRWLSHYRIKGVARDIASSFRLAQMMAVQRNQTCRVEFNSGAGVVRVVDNAGSIARTITLGEYKAQFDTARGGGNGVDFVDQPADTFINVIYNTRGIPGDEMGAPLTPPTPPPNQNGQRVFLINNRGEGYWVEVTPVGNVSYDRY